MGMILTEREQGDTTTLHLPNVDNDPPCPGCDAPEMNSCEFVLCNKAHGTDSCAFCPEFPCSMLIRFSEEWEHHRGVIDNLQRIRVLGIEKWITEQQEFWKCRKCGCRTQWYQRICTSCQEFLI